MGKKQIRTQDVEAVMKQVIYLAEEAVETYGGATLVSGLACGVASVLYRCTADSPVPPFEIFMSCLLDGLRAYREAGS